MKTLTHAKAGLALLAAVVVVSAGCERNAPTPFLIPTGLRPKPPVGTASITGQVVYDPVNCPDLDQPPYPPTVVQLWRDTLMVAADTLDRGTRAFTFERLDPGTYLVLADAHFFFPGSLPPVRVVTGTMEVGDLLVQVNPGGTSVAIHLFGDFNGFPQDFPDSINMVQNTLGVWSYPNADYPAQFLAAGVHHVRFVTDYSVDNPTDYGGDQSLVLDVPVAHAPVRLVSGPGTDLSFRITTPGRYAFTLDERRLSFSIEPLWRSAVTAMRRPWR